VIYGHFIGQNSMEPEENKIDSGIDEVNHALN
jgi:hypothetical protein